MATWKEDVVKALQNLGGIAHRSEIQEEVKRIRGDNLNSTWTQTIQRELESYSSDSDAFFIWLKEKEKVFGDFEILKVIN